MKEWCAQIMHYGSYYAHNHLERVEWAPRSRAEFIYDFRNDFWENSPMCVQQMESNHRTMGGRMLGQTHNSVLSPHAHMTNGDWSPHRQASADEQEQTSNYVLHAQKHIAAGVHKGLSYALLSS
jgi:hypothetical protein